MGKLQLKGLKTSTIREPSLKTVEQILTVHDFLNANKYV